jgi:hypothetical protein
MIAVAESKMSKTKLLRILGKLADENFRGLEEEIRHIRSKLRKKEITPAEAIKQLTNLLVAPTFKKQKEKETNEVIKVGKWTIGIKEIDNVGCHPTPENFVPDLKVNRKTKNALLIVSKGIYESNKHYNTLNYTLDGKETPKGFAILVKYELFRRALDFGKYREFNYIAGYEDGSVFIERVSPSVGTVEEALEWMKPAEVRKAEEQGRKVYRQGDVFFIELKSKRKTIFDYPMPRNHIPEELEDGRVIVKHHEHTYLILPHKYFKPAIRKTIWGRTWD